MRKFTKIRGEKATSDIRRLPRLGRIRGGIKVKRKSGNSEKCNHEPKDSCMYCTAPRETPHFIVPLEVAKVYGDAPTELDIMIPVNDLDIVFPQSYEMYGSGRGLKCNGDGEQALRFDEESKSMIEVPCPCEFLEKKKCSQRAHLSFILPKVSVGGVYTFTTTSFHSIVDINSSLDYITSLIGRFAMIPLKLKREPRDTHHDGKKQTHYTCRIELEGNIDFLNALRENNQRIFAGPKFALPAPERENPALDDVPVYPEDAGDTTPPEGEQRAVSPSDVPREGGDAPPTGSGAPSGGAQPPPASKKEAPADENVETKNFEFLKAMTTQKKRVGEEAYYKVLAKHKVKHSNKIADRGKQVLVFKDLDALPPDGCASDPGPCVHSSYDENLNVFCGDRECLFPSKKSA